MKRGQITLFIILGIIILFTVGFTLYMMQKPSLKPSKIKEETPLQTYVRQCIENVGKDAIIRLSMQGGYLEIPENIRVNVRSYLTLFPEGEPIVPYWYYREELRVPTKEMMENQISKYVVSQIKSCTGDFENFKNEFEIIEDGNISAKTTIGDKAVLITVEYPLKIKDKVKGEEKFEKTFKAELDVSLGRILSLARKILAEENKNMFFENETINLMAMNKNIPFSGMEFSCSPKIWKLSDIKKYTEDMLYLTIPQFRVKNVNYVPFGKEQLYEKNHFLIDLGDTNYNDLKVAFSYLPEWGLRMSAEPSFGGVLKANYGRSSNQYLLNLFCINMWHFVYDIEYPLLVMIRDDSAFNKEGLIFNFAFPVTIHYNLGTKKDIPVAVYDFTYYDYSFCNDTRNDETIVRVRDYYTLEDIYNANITYNCIKAACELGKTKPEAGTYRLRTKLPARCTGGALIANAPGYLQGSAYDTGQKYVEILMKPLKKFSVSFEKHLTTDLSKTEEIKSSEQVILSLESKELKKFLIYPGEEKTIELIDGDEKYKLEIFLLEKDRIVGGYLGDFDVKYEDIVGKNEIKFKIAKILPVPITDEELINAVDYLYNNQNYKNALKPEFI